MAETETKICFLCGRIIGRDANGVSYCSAEHAASFMSKVYALTGLIPAVWVHEDCNAKGVGVNVQKYRRNHNVNDDQYYGRLVLHIVHLSRLGRGTRQIARELKIDKNRVWRVLQSWRALLPVSVSQTFAEIW